MYVMCINDEMCSQLILVIINRSQKSGRYTVESTVGDGGEWVRASKS